MNIFNFFILVFVCAIIFACVGSPKTENDFKQKYPKLFDDENWTYNWDGMFYQPTNQIFKRYFTTYSTQFLIPRDLEKTLSSVELEVLESYICDLFEQKEQEYNNHPDRINEKREHEMWVRNKYG
jgi:hypothetical protein